MSILKDLHIVPETSDDIAISVFEGLVKDEAGNVVPFTDVDATNASDYIKNYWKSYQEFLEIYLAEKLEAKKREAIEQGKDPNKVTTNANPLNGSIFELIISTLLYKKGFKPFYTQAKVAFVPNVDYDIIFHTSDKNIICLTLKTSTRERIKQADLEAVALRYVHRRSITFLLTLTTREAMTQKKNLSRGAFLGLYSIIDCNNNEDLELLFTELSKNNFSVSETIDTVEGHLVNS